MPSRVTLLGPPDATNQNGDRARSLLAQPKRLALLGYLASRGRDAVIPRNELLAVFWPDVPERRARNSLSQALFFIRRSLGDRVVRNEPPDHVRLDAAEVSFDIWEDAATARGQFLEGVEVLRSREAQDWLDRERNAHRKTPRALAPTVRPSVQPVRPRVFRPNRRWIVAAATVVTLLTAAGVAAVRSPETVVILRTEATHPGSMQMGVFEQRLQTQLVRWTEFRVQWIPLFDQRGELERWRIRADERIAPDYFIHPFLERHGNHVYVKLRLVDRRHHVRAIVDRDIYRLNGEDEKDFQTRVARMITRDLAAELEAP